MPFDRDKVKAKVAALAQAGVFIGTSSWKYSGWRGMLYDDARYIYRGRFAESRFKKNCLTEYGEVFKTVCVDAAYYTFPGEKQMRDLAEQVPDGFRFAFKVTDEITVKRFPNLARFGARAGTDNEHFLDADLFAHDFLARCEPIKAKIGILIFEFSKFHTRDFARGRDFVEALDRFLGRLPPGWPYGVEIRNPGFLRPEYFAVLKRHQVAHVYNCWGDMPQVNEQMGMAGSRPSPELCAARFQLRPGRKFQEAVDLFQPYNQIKESCAEARTAALELIREGVREKRRRTHIYVNNRLEGNALETIAEILNLLHDD